MIQLQRILVPTDFSDCSRQAGLYGIHLAQRFEADVSLIHVLEPLTMVMPSPGAPLPEALLVDRREHAESELQAWLKPDLEGLSTVERSVEQGSPFVEIILAAKEKEVDLIVIGTHGRSGIMHALIGSVAERVVRKAPCPVLTVRPDGHQFVMP